MPIDDGFEVAVGDKTTAGVRKSFEIIGERVDNAYLEEMKAVTVDLDLVQSMKDGQ